MKDLKPQLKQFFISCRHCSDKVTWVVCIAILAITAFFMYNNFYKAITDARVLSTLKTQVALEVVDMDMWGKVNKNIEWKEQVLAADEKANRNPFR
jgi:hypothetical protein